MARGAADELDGDPPEHPLRGGVAREDTPRLPLDDEDRVVTEQVRGLECTLSESNVVAGRGAARAGHTPVSAMRIRPMEGRAAHAHAALMGGHEAGRSSKPRQRRQARRQREAGHGRGRLPDFALRAPALARAKDAIVMLASTGRPSRR
ncbi:MAG: hypothetical protein U5K43_07595 [Halofilum sp. (in: g-proteobacteria)]|nr:hypothetical protein [Halofilum sp. (in: g-proteobacteria)]